MSALRSLLPCLSAAIVLTACEGTVLLEADAPVVEPHLAAAQSVVTSYVGSTYPAYSDLKGASAEGTAGSLHLSVDTEGTIPRHPDAFIGSVAVFGYGWVDGDTGDGVVAVIHPLIGRDSNQNPDGWHTHPVTLGAGSAFDFCIISIGTSQGGIANTGGNLRLNMAGRQAGLAAEDMDVAASFIVAVDAGCGGLGLGVKVLDALSL
ncbi:MAG TPA: hypothetical protein VML95_10380 [Longimicrobiales bacterium]|nr:hypothetical protein [Longimicrobiales bacterium]